MPPHKCHKHFGNLIIASRDSTIKEFDGIINSALHDKKAGKQFKQLLASLDEKEMQILRKLAIWTVDATLHNMMYMFEEHKEIQISVECQGETVKDIRQVSDGLHGDVFSWAEEYSKEPLSHK